MAKENMRMEDTDISKIRGKHRQVKLEQVYDMENLIAAEKEARKGKGKKFGVMKFDRHAQENLKNIQRMLKERTYRRSPAKQEEQDCPCGKRRLLTKLPYYPDHIIDHALMRVIGKTMTRSYYYDSAASIKGKGTEFARRRVRKFLDKNRHRDIVWAKMDFRKFYHNIMQPIVYKELCQMYHNDGIRWLLKEVVATIPAGLGIGLYPIQPIANFHLNRLDRLVGEKNTWRGASVQILRRYAAHWLRYENGMESRGRDTEIRCGGDMPAASYERQRGTCDGIVGNRFRWVCVLQGTHPSKKEDETADASEDNPLYE